ncbi:MAG: DUF2085 domain-containing protein [Candidatus Helarchaeota archaeon]
MSEKREKIKKFLLFLLSHHSEEYFSRTIRITNSIRLCTRCTGMVLGFIISLLINFIFIPYMPWNLALLFMILMIIPPVLDWSTQRLKKRESNNKLRFITGFLLGVSFTMIIHLKEIILFVNILIFSVLFLILIINFKR